MCARAPRPPPKSSTARYFAACHGASSHRNYYPLRRLASTRSSGASMDPICCGIGLYKRHGWLLQAAELVSAHRGVPHRPTATATAMAHATSRTHPCTGTGWMSYACACAQWECMLLRCWWPDTRAACDCDAYKATTPVSGRQREPDGRQRNDNSFAIQRYIFVRR